MIYVSLFQRFLNYTTNSDYKCKNHNLKYVSPKLNLILSTNKCVKIKPTGQNAQKTLHTAKKLKRNQMSYMKNWEKLRFNMTRVLSELKIVARCLET